MQNGKVAELSGLVWEMVKVAAETEVDMIIALKSDCKMKTKHIVNSYKGEADDL